MAWVTAFRYIKTRAVELNFFESAATRSNLHDLRTAIIATRLYIIILTNYCLHSGFIHCSRPKDTNYYCSKSISRYFSKTLSRLFNYTSVSIVVKSKYSMKPLSTYHTIFILYVQVYLSQILGLIFYFFLI